MTTPTRTLGGARAYALLDGAFADPGRAREIAAQISALDAGSPQEEQEIADAARMCVKLIPGPRAAGLAAELASAHGHHVPGTPFTYRHGWLPLAGDTMTRYQRPDGTWEPGRQALHDQIVAKALAGHSRSAHPAAVFLGGGTASGKSTLFGGGSSGVKIDPDKIKEQLPEYPAGLAAHRRGTTGQVHEESSYLARRIQREAISRGYDFTLDSTGDGAYEKMRGKIEQARQAGYQVTGKYVTVPTELAVRRAAERARETGRVVPASVTREIHAGVSDVFGKLLQHNELDQAELWDNTASPRLIGRKEAGAGWTVQDPKAWRQFLAKAGQ